MTTGSRPYSEMPPPDIRIELTVDSVPVGISWKLSIGHTGRTFALTHDLQAWKLIAQIRQQVKVQEHVTEVQREREN